MEILILLGIGFALYALRGGLGLKFGSPTAKGYARVLYWRKIVENEIKIASNIIPPEIVLAIIAQESMGQDHTETGSAKEEGIMQITPMGLAYTGLPYTMNQIKNDQRIGIKVGIAHLVKDYNYLNGSIHNAIMAYNIHRDHIRRYLDGDPSEKDLAIIRGTGKNYLNAILKVHRPRILELLLKADIDNKESENFIEYQEWFV